MIRNRLHDWVAFTEFASWCLPIYALQTTRCTPEQAAMLYLETHLVRPLCWLGLLEKKEASPLSPIRTVQLRKTPLFETFLRFEIRRDLSRELH